MEKANKKIIYEAVLVHAAFNNELAGYSDNEYSRYHQQMLIGIEVLVEDLIKY